MRLEFTKMHGCGNDYVYVDGARFRIPAADKPDIVRRLSDRHFGIGGDGVIFINPAPDDTCDFEMEMWNADGTRSEMCGNGIRCVAKYVYDYGLTDKTEGLTIQSAGSNKYLKLSLTDEPDPRFGRRVVETVRVDMGAPKLLPAEVPVNLPDADPDRPVISVPIEAEGRTFRMTCVSMGNPHAVIYLPEDEDLGTFPIEKYGPALESHPVFPNRCNIEFIHVDDRKSVHMRVWERGTGETLACGTGTCAVTVAGVLNDVTDEEITIHVLGGDIVDRYDREAGTVFMTGPGTTVFEGHVEI